MYIYITKQNVLINMENQAKKGIRRSDSNRDALEGVVNYLHLNFDVKWDIDQVNDFMKQYRLSRDSNPSWRHSKNAQYIQTAFKDFAIYCNKNLKKLKR